MSAGVPTSLGMEQLESRWMLAGDVTVRVVSGHVFVAGDDAANEILITAGPTTNSLNIQGLGTTTVTKDGVVAPGAGLVIENVRGTVYLSLGGGDDALEVTGASFSRSLSIEAGAGNDTVQIGPAANATLQEKEDEKVAVIGVLSVNGGLGNDTVRIAETSVVGLLNVATGAGNDVVELGAPADDATPSVRASSALTLSLGEGADSAHLDDVASASTSIAGDAGADVMSLNGVRASGLAVVGGLDDAVDVATITGSTATVASITLGGGADQAAVADSVFTSLEAEMGNGNDRVILTTTTSQRTLLTGGNGGADEFVDAGANSLGQTTVTGFEVPAVVSAGIKPRLGRQPSNGLTPVRRLI